jgi:hypothetical protein
MKDKSVKYTLIGAVSLALLPILFIVVNVRSQEGLNNKQTARNTQPTKQQQDDEATPIVDFEVTRSAGADKNGRRGLKNARFDNSGFVIAQPTFNEGSVRMYDDPRDPISDLPVDKSDLVIEGSVVNSEAFLSNDKSGVYSEFTISVSRVLKIRSDLSVVDDTVVAERLGGRVRYSSGKIVRYTVGNEGSPVKGERYLFFLREAAQGNYRILTAYELQGNRVFALDSSKINARQLGQTIFDKHNGKDVGDFISEVEGAIRSSNSRRAEVPNQ